MAKKRKTKEQKRLADSRHTFTHSATYSSLSSASIQTPILNKNVAKTTTIAINSYPYLKKDLSKTTILTLFILLFQVVLFALLKNHIFVIPGINY